MKLIKKLCFKSEIMENDKRFEHVAKDPKFRSIPKREKKVKIDKRFQSMFKDKQFKVKYTVDKRGRPVNHSTTEDLRRYYELSSEDESDSESENETESIEPGKFVKLAKVDSTDLKVKHKDDKNVDDIIKKKLKNLKVDYARGKANLLSESSSDDEDETEEAEGVDDNIDHNWGELDADAERTDNDTYRLAACNMDWDRMRAVDLMVLFTSFLPPGGAITSVRIYTSDYGKKRLAEEEVKGPMELVETKSTENEEETEEGSKYHMEKLRQYQLNRLKYYYAVITCDNINTASKLYAECDGQEYESSATKIDLRFIPDDMDFEDEPKEICDKLPELDKYQPRFFTTTALQQGKVDLTWDETNPERIEVTEKLSMGENVTDIDIQAYLASSSEDEANNSNATAEDEEIENDKNPIDKYKALLQEIEEKEIEKNKDDVQMEITWGINLEEKTKQLVSKKMSQNESKTPFQQYLDKRKEKRKDKKKNRIKEDESGSESDLPDGVDMKDLYFSEEFNKPEFKKKIAKKIDEESEDEPDLQKEAELELLVANDEGDKKHFNLKNILDNENTSKSKKKNKNKDGEEKADEFKVNVKDERFSALYTSHHYNIDPTDPNFKKTKNMDKLIQEKFKRRADTNDDDMGVKKAKTNGESAELNVLVKSVKRKADAFVKNKRK